MNLTNEFQPIREWAQERGLIQGGDPITQFVKLGEEQGELAQALLKGNLDDFEDAVGDMVVVLTNMAAQRGIRIEDCINNAYNVIKHRKGSMQNGTFVKEG